MACPGLSARMHALLWHQWSNTRILGGRMLLDRIHNKLTPYVNCLFQENIRSSCIFYISSLTLKSLTRKARCAFILGRREYMLPN
jgi:hypothetical protein